MYNDLPAIALLTILACIAYRDGNLFGWGLVNLFLYGLVKGVLFLVFVRDWPVNASFAAHLTTSIIATVAVGSLWVYCHYKVRRPALAYARKGR
jgi:hypothetical protein